MKFYLYIIVSEAEAFLFQNGQLSMQSVPQNICIALIRRRPSVLDAESTLFQCYKYVLR